MLKYSLMTHERAMTGFTDLFILKKADWVANTTTAHVLTSLAVGDVVYRVLQETKTYLAGPASGTGSVGVVGALTQFTAASNLLSANNKYIAAVAAVTPYPTNTAVDMVFNAIIGAGAATAGEVWVWANIQRGADRNIVG